MLLRNWASFFESTVYLTDYAYDICVYGIRRFVLLSLRIFLANVFVSSRLDSCNLFLDGITNSNMLKVQGVLKPMATGYQLMTSVPLHVNLCIGFFIVI